MQGECDAHLVAVERTLWMVRLYPNVCSRQGQRQSRFKKKERKRLKPARAVIWTTRRTKHREWRTRACDARSCLQCANDDEGYSTFPISLVTVYPSGVLEIVCHACWVPDYLSAGTRINCSTLQRCLPETARYHALKEMIQHVPCLWHGLMRWA